MEVRFEDAALCRLCNRRASMVMEWGAAGAMAVAQHLQELEAVASLADIAQLPYVRVGHEGPDGRAWLEGTAGVRIGLRWDATDPLDERVGSWRDVTVVVVETVLVGGGEAHG